MTYKYRLNDMNITSSSLALSGSECFPFLFICSKLLFSCSFSLFSSISADFELLLKPSLFTRASLAPFAAISEMNSEEKSTITITTEQINVQQSNQRGSARSEGTFENVNKCKENKLNKYRLTMKTIVNTT